VGAGQSVCQFNPLGEREKHFLYEAGGLGTRLFGAMRVEMDDGIRTVIGAQMPGLRALGACQACQLGLVHKVLGLSYAAKRLYLRLC